MKIKEACLLLRDGYVLESIIKNDRLIFISENSKIKIYSAKYNSMMKTEDFLNLYKDQDFFPLQTKDDNSSEVEKDFEYYSRLQKKQ